MTDPLLMMRTFFRGECGAAIFWVRQRWKSCNPSFLFPFFFNGPSLFLADVRPGNLVQGSESFSLEFTLCFKVMQSFGLSLENILPKKATLDIPFSTKKAKRQNIMDSLPFNVCKALSS